MGRERDGMLKIKICGITSIADARVAAEAGADAIGLNFYAESPRFVEEGLARSIVRSLPSTVAAVGVFVNDVPAAIRRRAGSVSFRGVQTYDEICRNEDFRPLWHIPAFRVGNPNDLSAVCDYAKANPSVPSAILVDSHTPQIGGSGVTAPWHLLAGFDPGVPVILAGGLTPENVAEAIRIVRPFGVDVASGVESKPGVKDLSKVRDFIAAARAAFADL
jgi:phosphoribosylanthranilate isomerase